MQNFLLLPGKKKLATVKRSYFQFHAKETMIDLVLEASQAHQWSRKRTEAQVKSWAKPKPLQNTEPFRYPPAESPESSAVLCSANTAFLPAEGGENMLSIHPNKNKMHLEDTTAQPSFFPSPCAGVMTAYLYIISCLVISYTVTWVNLLIVNITKNDGMKILVLLCIIQRFNTSLDLKRRKDVKKRLIFIPMIFTGF